MRRVSYARSYPHDDYRVSERCDNRAPHLQQQEQHPRVQLARHLEEAEDRVGGLSGRVALDEGQREDHLHTSRPRQRTGEPPTADRITRTEKEVD